MNATRVSLLVMAFVLVQSAAAQVPPRLRPPIPPAERPRPGSERPVRPRERPDRAGWQQLPRAEMPDEFRAQGGPQIGLNFPRFFWDGPGQTGRAPDDVFGDLARLGATAYRQFVKADLLWDLVEPTVGQWTFTRADAVVPRAGYVPQPT